LITPEIGLGTVQNDVSITERLSVELWEQNHMTVRGLHSTGREFLKNAAIDKSSSEEEKNLMFFLKMGNLYFV
jgi:hypothetical protein